MESRAAARASVDGAAAGGALDGTAASQRGRGCATAAVALLSRWALTPERLALLVARCHTDNTRSQSVAQAAGFTLSGVDDQGYELYVRASPGHC